MRPADWPSFESSAGLTRLVAAAGISTFLSTLLTFILGNSISRPAFHVLFVAIVGSIGMVLGSMGFVTARVDSGVAFVFFLFEPIGRVLLHQEIAPASV